LKFIQAFTPKMGRWARARGNRFGTGDRQQIIFPAALRRTIFSAVDDPFDSFSLGAGLTIDQDARQL
jgi:hypothetical protein